MYEIFLFCQMFFVSPTRFERVTYCLEGNRYYPAELRGHIELLQQINLFCDFFGFRHNLVSICSAEMRNFICPLHQLLISFL